MGTAVEGQGVWDEVVLKDFAEFENPGLTHRRMAEIEAPLARAAPPPAAAEAREERKRGLFGRLFGGKG